MTTLRASLSVLLAAALLGGCLRSTGGAQSGAGFTGDEGDAGVWSDADGAASDAGPEVAEETEDTGSEPDADEPTDPPGPWCGPEPIGAVAALPPELPAPIEADVCDLVELREPWGAGRTRVTRYHVDPDLVQVSQYRENADGSVMYMELVRYRVDAAGRVAEIARGTLGSTAEPVFAASGEIDLERFDGAGHLLEVARYADPALTVGTTLIEQSWQGDRLVSRVDYTDVGTVKVAYAWTWEGDDAGRLIRSVGAEGGFESQGPEHVSAITWQDGRPAEVVYTIDGVEKARQTWSFGADGALRSRRIAREWNLYPYLALDSLQHGIFAGDYEYEGDPWAGAMATLDEGAGCRTLPVSSGHGYPRAEGWYDLGWPVDERPNGIGFVYGNGQYGWYYCDQGWWGHGGACTLPQGPVWGYWMDPTEIDVEYDERGRMVRESYRGEGEGDAPAEIERVRVFEGERLKTDTLSSPTGSIAPRELGFHYDDAGRIALRELRHGGVKIAWQLWSWSAAGEWLEHVVWLTSAMPEDPEPPAEEPALTSGRRYYRELDAQDRLTARGEEEQDPESGSWTVTESETRSYAADGSQMTRLFGSDPESMSREISYYGPGGRLDSLSLDSGDNGSLDYTESWTYNAAGLWVRRENVWTSGQAPEIYERSFACEP